MQCQLRMADQCIWYNDAIRKSNKKQKHWTFGKWNSIIYRTIQSDTILCKTVSASWLKCLSRPITEPRERARESVRDLCSINGFAVFIWRIELCIILSCNVAFPRMHDYLLFLEAHLLVVRQFICVLLIEMVDMKLQESINESLDTLRQFCTGGGIDLLEQ